MSGTTLKARIQNEIRKRLKRTDGKRDRAALLVKAGRAPEAAPVVKRPVAEFDFHGLKLVRSRVATLLCLLLFVPSLAQAQIAVVNADPLPWVGSSTTQLTFNRGITVSTPLESMK
jgi:hypothetical protein